MRKLSYSLAAFALIAMASAPALADHQPADKVAWSGSTIEVMQNREVAGADYSVVSLLPNGPLTFKSSSPSDLYISVTAETALITNILGKGKMDEPEGAVAQVEIWVEIDDVAIPVSHGAGTPDGEPDDGTVVFNNRDFRIKTKLNNIIEEVCQDLNDDGDTDDFGECLLFFTDEEQEVALYLSTRSANGFNWLALNVGSGMHELDVYAKLSTELTNDDQIRATAMVGKRSISVLPGKLANDANF